MIYTFKKPLLNALVIFILTLMGVNAHASSVILKHDHDIQDATIFLGDLFDLDDAANSAQMIDQDLLPGKIKTYSARTLAIIAMQYQIDWKADTGKEQVLITRTAIPLAHAKLKEIFTPKVAEASGDPSIAIKFDKRDYGIFLPIQEDLAFKITEFTFDPIHKKFSSRLVIENLSDADQALKGPHYISGQTSNMIEVPILIKPMRAGDIITKRDIDFIEISSKTLSPQMIVSTTDLIGKTPRQLIKPHTLITDRDVLEPIIVKKNALVRMLYKSNSIQISAKGKALQHGAKGDVITVMNTASKKEIQAEVTNLNEVTIPNALNDGS